MSLQMAFKNLLPIPCFIWCVFSGLIVPVCVPQSNLYDYNTAMFNIMPHVKHLISLPRIGRPKNRGLNIGMGMTFLLQASRPVQVSTEPALEWITRVLSSADL
jgi:hypothetical protein